MPRIFVSAMIALAAIFAVVIPPGMMKPLLNSYLKISDVDGLAWVIFKINPMNTFVFFAVLICAYLSCLWVAISIMIGYSAQLSMIHQVLNRRLGYKGFFTLLHSF